MMIGIHDDVGRRAAKYIAEFGHDAARQVASEVNQAAELQNWDAVRELERVRLRVRRAQLCDQIRDRLELTRMRPAIR